VTTLRLLRFVWNSNPRLLMRLSKNLEEMCRSAFVTALVSEGIGQRLLAGPASLEKLHDNLALDDARDELEAWLDVGVDLGELGKDQNGYRLTGLLSRRLSHPDNAVWHAFFQVRTDIFFDYVRNTPLKLRRHERFRSDEAQGELFAQSSRTVELLMLDLVERIVPAGKRRMLEVGCGSGVYLKRAWPDLGSGAWGLEPGVWSLGSGAWGLEPGVWSLGSGAWGLEPGVWSPGTPRWFRLRRARDGRRGKACCGHSTARACGARARRRRGRSHR
jgi:hypothetical protein